AFNCPIVRMNYESAELCKLAINYYLAKQIETANELAQLADALGAYWPDVVSGLRLDKRIGEHAYIVPGEIGGHLPRDVKTIERLLEEHNVGRADHRRRQPDRKGSGNGVSQAGEEGGVDHAEGAAGRRFFVV